MTADLTCARRLALGVAFGLGLMAAGTGAASAQTAECDALKTKFEAFANQIKQAQGLAKSKAGPDKACGLFTQLQATQASLVPLLEKDGAWCHVPDQTLQGVKAQAEPIGKAKANACTAAVKFKQMEQQARKQQEQRGPGLMGGGDSVVGGPVKMPQGAL